MAEPPPRACNPSITTGNNQRSNQKANLIWCYRHHASSYEQCSPADLSLNSKWEQLSVNRYFVKFQSQFWKLFVTLILSRRCSEMLCTTLWIKNEKKSSEFKCETKQNGNGKTNRRKSSIWIQYNDWYYEYEYNIVVCIYIFVLF